MGARGETYVGKPCPKGHVVRYLNGRHCVECSRAKTVAFRLDHPGYNSATRQKNWRIGNPVRNLVINTRSFAKKIGVSFSISSDDLFLTEACPCCGEQFVFGSSKTRIHAAALARIDIRRGYVPGNVDIICWGCLQIISRAGSLERLESIIAWQRRKLGEMKLRELVAAQ